MAVAPGECQSLGPRRPRLPAPPTPWCRSGRNLPMVECGHAVGLRGSQVPAVSTSPSRAQKPAPASERGGSRMRRPVCCLVVAGLAVAYADRGREYAGVFRFRRHGQRAAAAAARVPQLAGDRRRAGDRGLRGERPRSPVRRVPVQRVLAHAPRLGYWYLPEPPWSVHGGGRARNVPREVLSVPPGHWRHYPLAANGNGQGNGHSNGHSNGKKKGQVVVETEPEYHHHHHDN